MKKGKNAPNIFLNLEKFRAKSNIVFELKDREGNLINNENDIVEEFAKHFEAVYNDFEIDENKINNKMDDFIKNINLKSLNIEEKQESD